MTTDYVMLYITAASREQALTISHALLAERLIACANIHEHVTSMHRWQGEIERSQEVVIFAKTRASLVARATERVKALHSYQTPCIISLPLTGGHPAFLEWIGAETKDN